MHCSRGALSESAGNHYQLVESDLALHLHSRWLSHGTKYSRGLAAFPFADSNTHLRILDVFRVSLRDVFLQCFFGSTLCGNRPLQKSQRGNIAVTVDFDHGT